MTVHRHDRRARRSSSLITCSIPTDIPTALTNAESVCLARLAKGRQVLEVGALLGHSTIVLAGTAERIVSVDPHCGYPPREPRSTLKAYVENLARHRVNDRVTSLVSTLQRADPYLADATFDLAFIDYCEDDGGPTLELMEIAARKLKFGGLLVVHDYEHPTWRGATRAVDEWVTRSGSARPAVVETLAIVGV